MSNQPAIRPQPSSDFGVGSLACILPQVETPIAQQIEDLQGKLENLTLELNLLRKRDEHVSDIISRLDEEQRLAARLQRDFLPKVLPRLGGIEFGAIYRPASYVSGDMYDAMRIDEHHLGFYIADAVGHGMPAALLSMFMKNALITKDIAANGYKVLSPSESLSRLNNSLCEQNLSSATFATAVYGTIDVRTLTMTVARGGHPHPLFIRNGEAIAIEPDGALLGIFPDESFSTCTVQLQPGDKVFVYTDGIEVAFSESETADDEIWRHKLGSLLDKPLDEALKCFNHQLEQSGGSLLPKDDLTILAFEVKETK